MAALKTRLRELEALPALVEVCLHDLPDLVDRRRVVRDYETVPAEMTPDNPLGLYRLRPDRVRLRSDEDTEGAHTNGTLVLRWSCGERTLPAVMGFKSSVLRYALRHDEGR